MSQISTHRTTYMKTLASRAFRVGFDEVKSGKPFNPENTEWNYERGRQFACLYEGEIKTGRKVNLHALYAFSYAVKNNYII